MIENIVSYVQEFYTSSGIDGLTFDGSILGLILGLFGLFALPVFLFSLVRRWF